MNSNIIYLKNRKKAKTVEPIRKKEFICLLKKEFLDRIIDIKRNNI